MERHDIVWQRAALAETFIKDVRGGVPYAADQIEMMLRAIDARSQPVTSFIDLGCGSGVVARALLARYPQARALLVDFSEAMLAEANAQLGAHPNVLIVSGDLASSEWLNAVRGSAPDLVVSGYAIHHLAHSRKRELYAEIFDLLPANGMFINIEHVASRSPQLEAASDELMIDTIHAFQRSKGSNRAREQVASEFVHRPDKTANILAPVETQCEWLRAIGFAEVDCYFKVFELAVFGGRKPAAGAARRLVDFPPTLATDRLLFRRPTLDDAEVIYAGWATDPQCTRYLMWRPHTAVEQTREFLQRVIADEDPIVGHPWLVSTRDGEVIGMIDLRPGAAGAETGYVFRRSAWGQGYGTEALRAVIAAGFAAPGIHRVWATCDVENRASARVLEKAGMSREGLLRRYISHPNVSDEPRDSYLFAATRSR